MIRMETKSLSQQNNYDNIFDFLSSEKEKEELAKIFDYSINQIKYILSDFDREHKIGCLYVIKELYLLGIKLKDKEAINNVIEDYLNYLKTYDTYINEFALITDMFDVNLSFYDKFIDGYIEE